MDWIGSFSAICGRILFVVGKAEAISPVGSAIGIIPVVVCPGKPAVVAEDNSGGSLRTRDDDDDAVRILPATIAVRSVVGIIPVDIDNVRISEVISVVEGSYMRKLRGYTVSKRMKDGLTIK